MSVRLRLEDDIVFQMEASYGEVKESWAQAIDEHGLLEVVSPAGQSRYINARQAVYLEELEPEPKGRRRRRKRRLVPDWLRRPHAPSLHSPRAILQACSRSSTR